MKPVNKTEGSWKFEREYFHPCQSRKKGHTKYCKRQMNKTVRRDIYDWLKKYSTYEKECEEIQFNIR